MIVVRALFLSIITTSLAGCQTVTGPASVKGGECRIFERPEYAVQGKRQPDQDWIDSQIEGGVGGCGWKRPKPRPASFDAAPAPHVAAPVRAKKRGVFKRIKDRVVHPFTKSVAPILESPAVPTVSMPKLVVVPRDPVDELLHPSK